MTDSPTTSSTYDDLKEKLLSRSHTWLITGVAGFIGSNLLETLLQLNQRVVGLDNFATGHQSNLNEVQANVGKDAWSNFQLMRGDIRVAEDCSKACVGIDYVLHHAALGSVPRSIGDPATSNTTNVTGFLNMLIAARDAKVKRFVYAASSSTYGDHPGLPKIEDRIGKPLSPYAVTKLVNELYGDVFSRCYDFNVTGLRYFNVFGPRQDPNGAYAAVIPKWISAMLNGRQVYINGDGTTSRDFCFVENVVQANLLAATSSNVAGQHHVFNIAVGGRTDLNQMFKFIRDEVLSSGRHVIQESPILKDFRAGDVLHSQADITKAMKLLGYAPRFDVRAGISKAMPWYLEHIQTH